LFQDLVHFVPVFPHPRLTVEVLLTEQEEHRIRRKQRRGPGFTVTSRTLISVIEKLQLRSHADFRALLPAVLEYPCTTADIATAAEIPRWLAQKMAYCLRHANILEQRGKRGHAWLYALSDEIENEAA
jgi:hypothetical protein